MKSFRILALAAALMAAPALAQSAPQQQAPKPTDEKEFTDWAVRCYAVKTPTPCEMTSFRVVKKTGQRLLGVSIRYAAVRDAYVLVISVPLGVAFSNGLIINTDTYKSPVLQFRYCAQTGCFIEVLMPGDVISSIAKATKAKVDIVPVGGKPMSLQMSLKGFSDARSAMVELAKSKASGGASAPAAPAEPAAQ